MRASVAAVLLTLAAAGSGDTWRWTDDEGRVHYSDSLPPSGRDAEHVELPDPGEPDPDDRANSRQQRALELLEEGAAERRREENAKNERRQAEQRRECDRKRNELAELKRRPPLMREDFPGLLYEEHRAHEREIEALEQWLDDHC